ncbi:MAG: hypothetical protein HDT34_04950 [Clostridiales bacterium]|nr:hypothetical protein [Clostridiales bacterium]
MKKIFKLIIVSILICSFLTPYTAFAETNEAATEWQDIELTDEEFESLLVNNPNNAVSTYTTGLITRYGISVSKSGSNLVITGVTNCMGDVVKCGFSKVTIQQRKNSNSSWSNYQSYSSLYIDKYSYNLSKTLAVPSGYQYRVTCTHYAKKSLFSTEKIDNTSNIVTF